ncbi:hypothetical protein [Actinophytocola sp.]|uniref:hypothetical protein n=1 Tax=Actinophytocola sp. TaxID=1872138 RepID=UPI003D6A80F8
MVPAATHRSELGRWAMSRLTWLMSFASTPTPSPERPVPEAIVTTAGMAEANAKLLAEDGERDPAVLADRIGTLANEFDAAASRSRAVTVDWLQGAQLPPSAVACHLLEECLVHGHDIARATGRRASAHRGSAAHCLLEPGEGRILPSPLRSAPA